jgi:hypothetical protein
VVNAGDDQGTYHAFVASTLLPQQQFNLTIDGLVLPPAPAASVSSLNPVVIWIIVTVVVMLIIVALSWYLTSSRRRQSRVARVTSAGGSIKAKAGGTNVKKKAAVDTSADRREQLLQEMLRLDRAFEEGKMSKATYEERRSKAKARLRTVISERETIRP